MYNELEVVKKEIRRNIIRRMKELGINIKELSQRAQISKSQIRLFGRNFTLEDLVKIAVALDTKLFVAFVNSEQDEKITSCNDEGSDNV